MIDGNVLPPGVLEGWLFSKIHADMEVDVYHCVHLRHAPSAATYVPPSTDINVYIYSRCQGYHMRPLFRTRHTQTLLIAKELLSVVPFPR